MEALGMKKISKYGEIILSIIVFVAHKMGKGIDVKCVCVYENQ